VTSIRICIAALALATPSLLAQMQMPGRPQAPPTSSGSPIPSGSPTPSASPMPSASPNIGAQEPAFAGTWCVGGDPTKQATIVNNGAFYIMTNEAESTSIGNPQGDNQVVAPGWQSVVGTINAKKTQINWSNGTSWSRCHASGGGNRTPALNGTWHPNGNLSLSCSIQQHRGALTLQNETGQQATGSFDDKQHLTTDWQGTKITGTVSSDSNRINWSNGTYWVRDRPAAK
jgi:hypothetical protein